MDTKTILLSGAGAIALFLVWQQMQKSKEEKQLRLGRLKSQFDDEDREFAYQEDLRSGLRKRAADKKMSSDDFLDSVLAVGKMKLSDASSFN